MTIKHASFGPNRNPYEVLQQALDMDNIQGLALCVVMEDGSIYPMRAGLTDGDALLCAHTIINDVMWGDYEG